MLIPRTSIQGSKPTPQGFLKTCGLDLDGANRKRTRMRLFQFSLRDQASNWLERLPAGSIFTWEDLTTRFLAQSLSTEEAEITQAMISYVTITSRKIFQKAQGTVSRTYSLIFLIFMGIHLKTLDCPSLKPISNQTTKLRCPTKSTSVFKGTSTDRMRSIPRGHGLRNPKLNVNSTSPILFARSYPTKDPQCSTHILVSITVHSQIHPSRQQCNPHNDKPEEEEQEEKDDPENINTNPSSPPDPSILRRKLNPKDDPNRGVSNFTGRIKGIHVFIGNFTYVIDFMIVEDICSIINPRLSQVVLGKPFVQMSNMTHDLSKGVVRFTNGTNEIAYKMPHKIEQYNSLSDLEKEHTKSVYLRNEEDKRRGAEYAMRKILGFYKECLELGPKYLT
ncbi:retrotransposon ORF1 [Tanacetum coccineum]